MWQLKGKIIGMKKFLWIIALIAIIGAIYYEAIFYTFVCMFAYRDLADGDLSGKYTIFKASFIYFTLVIINLYSIYVVIKLIRNKIINKFQKISLFFSLIQAIPVLFDILMHIIKNLVL